MRQIDLTVANHDTDKIMPTQPLKKPLKRLDSLENEAHYVTENGSHGEENSETSLESSESGNSENIDCVSPRSSRSSSCNSTPEVSASLTINTTKTRVLNGPAYARNLLRKRMMAPEMSSDYLSADDVRAEDDTRMRILDYKSDVERPSGFRKYSFNDKLKNLVDMSRESNREKAAAMKKLITSPNLLRKSQSFKTTDSVSSSAENEHLEKRKKRKISIGKRSRKSSKSQLVDKENDQKHEKHEKPEQRSNKFRRRKLVKSQSESSLSSYDVKKSKLILLYSGDSSIKSEKLVRKNRVDLLKHSKESSVESSSEYDDYSSAFSDVEVLQRNLSPNSNNKARKMGRRGFAKRVWKSINSLFLTEDSTALAKPSPPSNRKSSPKISKKSRSMPGSLDRVKSFSGRKSSFLKSDDNLLAKDDLVLLKKNKKKHSIEELTLATKLQRIFKFSRENVLDDSLSGRSKSLDYLLDYSVAPKDSPVEWFEQRRKAHSTLTQRENDKRVAKNSLQYKIMISQQPSPNKDGDPSPSNKLSNKLPTSQKIEKLLKRSTTFDNKSNSSSANLSKLKKSKSIARRKGLIKVRLQDIKLVCHRELELFLAEKPFEPSEASDWCRTLSESIKDRIMKITEDNYKIVAQVFIGALCDDGIHAAVQCTTQKQNNDGDESDEGFFTVTFKGKDLFAVASVLYFELQ